MKLVPGDEYPKEGESYIYNGDLSPVSSPHNPAINEKAELPSKPAVDPVEEEPSEEKIRTAGKVEVIAPSPEDVPAGEE